MSTVSGGFPGNRGMVSYRVEEWEEVEERDVGPVDRDMGPVDRDVGPADRDVGPLDRDVGPA